MFVSWVVTCKASKPLCSKRPCLCRLHAASLPPSYPSPLRQDPSRAVRLAGQQPFLVNSDPNAFIYGGSSSLEERREEGAGPAGPGGGGAAVTPAGAVRPAATAMDAEQFSTGMANDLDKLLAGLQENAAREQPAAVSAFLGILTVFDNVWDGNAVYFPFSSNSISYPCLIYTCRRLSCL